MKEIFAPWRRRDGGEARPAPGEHEHAINVDMMKFLMERGHDVPKIIADVLREQDKLHKKSGPTRG